MNETRLIVAIKYNYTSKNFFIDFFDDDGYLISVLITEGIAKSLSKCLGLKILM